MAEFNVSLRKPGKCSQIKQFDREERVYEHVKNVINGDQMPLHRNESASQKTLNIQDTTPMSKKTTPCQENE